MLEALLKRHPEAATARNAQGRTPLHILCGACVQGGAIVANAAALVNVLLASAPGAATVPDANGGLGSDTGGATGPAAGAAQALQSDQEGGGEEQQGDGEAPSSPSQIVMDGSGEV